MKCVKVASGWESCDEMEVNFYRNAILVGADTYIQVHGPSKKKIYNSYGSLVAQEGEVHVGWDVHEYGTTRNEVSGNENA